MTTPNSATPTPSHAEEEARYRAKWLHERNAIKDWVVLTEQEVAAIKRELAAVSAERDQWKKNYYDVADAICRESTSTEDLCNKARLLRQQLADAKRDGVRLDAIIKQASNRLGVGWWHSAQCDIFLAKGKDARTVIDKYIEANELMESPKSVDAAIAARGEKA